MKLKGPLLLTITAVLWGMAFVAQTSAAANVGPFTFNASRNIVGALFLAGVIAMRKRTGSDEAPSAGNGEAPVKKEGGEGSPESGNGEGSPGSGGYTRRTLAIAGVACGLVLATSSLLQQAGISSYPDGVAVSGRSGFITALYMVMVAVMAQFMGRRQRAAVWASVAVALVGMYLLCVPEGLGNVYVGDWLTLACALGFALHIIVIDRFPHVDGVRLSQLQLIVSAVLSLAGALVFEHPDPTTIAAAAIPILYAGICSDGIAYTLQIIGQKTTDPTVASVIMSLEAVFAALGGWIILSESLSGIELAGCALVFAAVLLAQAPDIASAIRARRSR